MIIMIIMIIMTMNTDNNNHNNTSAAGRLRARRGPAHRGLPHFLSCGAWRRSGRPGRSPSPFLFAMCSLFPLLTPPL